METMEIEMLIVIVQYYSGDNTNYTPTEVKMHISIESKGKNARL